MDLVWEANEGEGRNIIVKFCYLGVLWSSVGENWLLAAESLIRIFIPGVTEENQEARLV